MAQCSARDASETKMKSCTMRSDPQIPPERQRLRSTEHGIFIPLTSVTVLAGGP